jgi:hypothetical protein
MKKDWLIPRVLSERLGRGEVGNREASHLMLANSIFGVLIYYVPFHTANPSWTLLSFYEGVVVLVIAILGLAKCYDSSGGDSNPKFIFEYICLSFPIWLWSSVFVWAIYRAIDYGFRYGVLKMSVENYQFAKNLASFGGSFIWLMTFLAIVLSQFLYFLWMASSLKHVKHVRENNK